MSKGLVLVTGGAGFIGSYVVDELLDRGYKVRVYDDLLDQVHQNEDLASDGWPIYLSRECELVHGNLLDRYRIRQNLKGVDYVIHLAASVGVGQSMAEIYSYTKNNVLATSIFLEEISRLTQSGELHLKKIIGASSMSIYGEGSYMYPDGKLVDKIPERTLAQLKKQQYELMSPEGIVLTPIPTSEDKRLEASSIYAVNKLDHELYSLIVGKMLGIPTTMLRLFNTYGPRQSLKNPYTGMVAIFSSSLLNNNRPTVFEDGNQRRDIVNVKDVARAFVMALESDRVEWETYNVGSGTSVSVNEVALKLASILGKDIEPLVTNKYRVGDIRNCYADITKINKNLGYKPMVTLDEGMTDLLEWLVKQNPTDNFALSFNQLKNNKLLV